MIVDLQKFILHERPVWTELEKLLNRIEADPHVSLPLDQVQRFHELYERTAADLARITTYSSEPETRRFLENLVARAYGEIHETREKQRRFRPVALVFQNLAANIPPPCARLLSLGGHHAGGLCLWRAGRRV